MTDTTLPIHPRTGERALGFWRSGRPIWPVVGGSGEGSPSGAGDSNSGGQQAGESQGGQGGHSGTQAGGDQSGQPTNSRGQVAGQSEAGASGQQQQTGEQDEPLGEGGKKALQAEREARKQLEDQVKKLQPLEKLLEAFGGSGDEGGQGGQTDVDKLTERLSNHEKELHTEREARWRAEIANDKKLTADQAAELRGSTRDELSAHADRLLSLFPQSQQPGTPKPDPKQGGNGGGGMDIDSRIQEAQKKGNWREVISLQNQKLADQHNQ